MVWDSMATATWFDGAMLVLFAVVLVYTRNQLSNSRGALLIALGVVVQSCVYLVEIIALHALPKLASEQIAQQTLATLSNLRGTITVLAMLAIVAGFMLIQHRTRATITALREGQRQLSSVLDATPDGILTLDRDGRVTTVNGAAERLFDTSRHWLIGTAIRDLLPDVPIDPADVTTVDETPARRRDGTRFTAAVTVLLSGSKPGEYVVTVRDISRQLELEAALRRSQRLDAVGHLSGGIAHDFNNHLTVILGYVEMLDGPDLTPELQQGLARIREAAQRSTRLTNQLLAFSRRQILEPRVVDVNALIEQMMGLIRSSVAENVAVDTLLATDLRPVRVDPSQLEQVLLNLVLNARDALPDGGNLHIETANVSLDERYRETHESALPGPYVMLSIRDDGTGIDAASLEHIFEPFFTTKEIGTGLGLATVQGIVAQSGGTIDVLSEPGRGTTFKIYLPPAEIEAEPVELSDEPYVPQAASSERVLVVEDEQLLRELVAATLAREGYDVLQAADGEEGIRVGLAETPDLLITDVVMPKCSGVDVSRELLAHDPGLRVIFMSGYAEDRLSQQGELDPTVTLLRKPFTPDRLLSLTRATLDERPRARTNGAAEP
jgi:PAS domain S-box-containing protein